MRFLHVLMLGMVAAGCAAPIESPVPNGYTGPVAIVSDSGRMEGLKDEADRAHLFVLEAVDGRRIPDSTGATRHASAGMGFMMQVSLTERQVPAKPMKASIKGTFQTGAPIHELSLRAAGSFLSVQGVVDFSPAPNGKYVVKGNLKKGESSVWIEDSQTGQVVTEKVVEKK